MACPNSHDRDLDVVDRGQRIEQAVPLLTALPPDPELTGRRSEVERWCLEPVDVHCVAQDGEVALLLRQPTRDPAPRVAPILAPPHRGRAAGADTLIGRPECFAAVLAQIVAAGRDAEMDAIPVANDRVHAEPAIAGVPLARVLVVADAGYHFPRIAAILAPEQGRRLHA